MRTLALALLIAVPTAAFAQQKPSLLDPTFEQPTAITLAPQTVASEPIYRSLGFWLSMSAVTLYVLSVVAFAAYSAIPRSTAPALTPSQLCPSGCDGWVNPPVR